MQNKEDFRKSLALHFVFVQQNHQVNSDGKWATTPPPPQ